MVRDCPSNARLIRRLPGGRAESNRCGRFLMVFAAAVTLLATSLAGAQQRTNHYFQRADMPPGSIGRAQLLRGGPLPGYFQAVELAAPEGTMVALATDGVFEPPQDAPLKAGLLIGQVYRFKVTNIPFQEGQEVFPSIEVINRLYPPESMEARYPIPIELTREELEMALRGQFVIRVIYLENPRAALPRREDPVHQRYFDVGASQDPLKVADGLGRPMAILRIGSRVPELDQVTGRFLFQSPPWIRFPEVVRDEPTATPAVPRTDIPRTDIPRTDIPRTDIPRTDIPRTDNANAASIGRPILPPVTAQRPQSRVGAIR